MRSRVSEYYGRIVRATPGISARVVCLTRMRSEQGKEVTFRNSVHR